jgi:hypothetical protein
VVIVAIIAAIVVSVSSGDDDEGSSPETTTEATTETPSTTSAPSTTETPSTTSAPSTTSPPPATDAPSETSAPSKVPPSTDRSATTLPTDSTEPTCGYVGTDSFGDMQIELAVANPLGAVPALDVTYALLSEGERFLTESAFIQYVAPGERFRIDVDTFTEPPLDVDEASIDCEVVSIEEGFGSPPTPPASDDGCEFVELDSFGDIQIELDVGSPFPTTEDIYVLYALRGPDGVRFADSLVSVGALDAGERVVVSEDTFTEPPAWVGNDITCSILGFETL